ncbi:prolyl-tRNA synthetase associated domain-containing protein [Gallaecimonas mangrovi]|uniref:prolyl-tRNA synthetase associated domain-containing protein n=1 Tax=Gallaecimonas mangrovi TaxID=2291597 RepID=UPI000E1FF445|nr:prolyl-tRNA synthetase associated domain-containing protein [Gallaecimonas mangrovi]
MPLNEDCGPKALLAALDITFEQIDHPPLTDCQAADKLGVVRPGQRIKNLFLRDNYGKKHVLLLVPAHKQVDLKALSKQTGLSRLGFASPERLEKYLGVKPGAVSLLALINDRERAVRLWVDEGLWQGDDFQCHPLVSTQTLVISPAGVKRFCQHLGYQLQLLPVPVRD